MSLSRGPRSDAADAITVILFGAVAAVVVIATTALRFLDVFRDGAVAWMIDVDDGTAESTVDSGAASVSGIVENLLVIAPDVDVAARVALGASITLWSVAALLVIGATMFVASQFLRGRLFVATTARAFDVIGWTIVLGGFGILLLENVGSNGVLAALGAPTSPLHPAEFWAFAPAWAVGTSVGLIALAFRRGTRLQRDTEGLV